MNGSNLRHWLGDLNNEFMPVVVRVGDKNIAVVDAKEEGGKIILLVKPEDPDA